MQSQFQEQIERGPVTKSDRVLIAVSGGLDSMVLLQLFQNAGYNVGVAHCNFQLRGTESDEDEQFIKATSSKLSVPFYSQRFDTNNYAEQNGISIQMAARELRYAWFAEVMEKHACEFLATGHHLNDNLETVILNFVRGTGLSGLQGIPKKMNNIVRPLLNFTKKEIELYARDNKIMWREDSSNASDDYQRNLVRHHIVPKLLEINPGLEKTFLSTVNRLEGASELMQRAITQLKDQFEKVKGDQVFISKNLFSEIENQGAILWEIIKGYGFNSEQCGEIVLASKGQSGKKFLSPSYELVVDREQLIISPHREHWADTIIKNSESTSTLGPWILDIEESVHLIPTQDKLEALLDGDLIKFPLRWRKWREGDVFYPLGMENRKKLSDFFVDNKLSVAEKSAVTVLESEDSIIWVVGYRIDNRFKVTAKTKKALKMSIDLYFT